MGWEKRGKNYYYYDKKKINGKIVSIYCGKQTPERILIKKAFNQLLDKLTRLRHIKKLTKQQAIDLLSSLPCYNKDLINTAFCELIQKDYKDLSAYTNISTINYLKFINLCQFFEENHPKADSSLLIKMINKTVLIKTNN